MQEDEIEAKESDYLFTQTSQISGAGLGLFTAITIFKDEVICLFKGEQLSDEEADTRIAASEDQYFINLLDGTIMDSKHVDCFAKYANDAAGPGDHAFNNNAKIGLNELDQVCLIAERNIKAQEEIFCGYGEKYWKRHAVEK